MSKDTLESELNDWRNEFFQIVGSFEKIAKQTLRRNQARRFSKALSYVDRILRKLDLTTMCQKCGARLIEHDAFEKKCVSFLGVPLTEDC